MRLFLNVTTATKSIALYNDDTVLATYQWKDSGKESEHVLPGIMQVLREQKADFSSLSDLYVVTGPGSFTGLRIALSVANTLAYAYPGLQLHALTVGDMFAVKASTTSKVLFQVYPSDVFIFESNGNFIDRLPSKDFIAGDDLYVGEVLDSLDVEHITKIQQRQVLSHASLLAIEEKAEQVETLLHPFYAKHPNISIPKKPL